jgi:rfaE bifunctional protein nucleotidyltransferase chain/domain
VHFVRKGEKSMSVKNILANRLNLQDRYIPDYDNLSETVKSLKSMGYSISMTQGVFDLLHTGHTRYINEAKSHGDIVVLAVDSDEYTRLRKQSNNERRPFVPFNERLEILANLRSVDIVTMRDVDRHKDDPYCVIKVVKPDVLIMSSSTKDVTEHDHQMLRDLGINVVVLEAQDTVSTTKRLREFLTDGAAGLADHIIDSVSNYFTNAGREISFFPKSNGEKKND